MSDQNQNYTAKSFSSVWVFLWLQIPAQNPSALLQNTLQFPQDPTVQYKSLSFRAKVSSCPWN